MLGTLVNCATVIVGGLVGMVVKKGISDKLGNSIMYALALCVMYIGISGALDGENVLITILSLAIGTIIGETIDLDKHLNSFANNLERRIKGKDAGDGDNMIARGFVSASLLFCVGAMTVVGSLQSGLSGNHETLFAKSLIDGIAAMVLSSTMGIGVVLSSLFVLMYQGAITLCAGFLEPILTETVVNEMTCVGSLLIVGISLNMLGITKLKLMNYIPAIFMPILICYFIK